MRVRTSNAVTSVTCCGPKAQLRLLIVRRKLFPKDSATSGRRIEKKISDLKLRAVAARKAESAAALRRDSVAVRQQQAGAQCAAAESGHRASGQLAATHKQSARAKREVQPLNDPIGSRPGADLESVAARFAQLEQSLAAVADWLGSLERNVAALAGQASESRDLVGADIRRIENQLTERAAALGSSRTADAQTGDLVERVIEALESLQSTALDQPEAGAMAVN